MDDETYVLIEYRYDYEGEDTHKVFVGSLDECRDMLRRRYDLIKVRWEPDGDIEPVSGISVDATSAVISDLGKGLRFEWEVRNAKLDKETMEADGT